MSKTAKRLVGDWGEDRAVDWLEARDYQIILRNYEVIILGKKAGEIDIIAWHKKPHFGNTLCFIEVKTRGVDDGTAERATGKEKLKRLLTSALAYCREQTIDIERTPIHFEQVSIYGHAGETRPAVRHYVIPVD